MPSSPKTPSTWTLRGLAKDVFEDHDCSCEVETDDGDVQCVADFDGCATCPCAGDECWKCAAAQALANGDSELALLREALGSIANCDDPSVCKTCSGLARHALAATEGAPR